MIVGLRGDPRGGDRPAYRRDGGAERARWRAGSAPARAAPGPPGASTRRTSATRCSTSGCWSRRSRPRRTGPRLREVYDAVSAALRGSLGDSALVLCHVSHVYETGASLYFTVAAAEGDDPLGRWHAAKAAAMDAIVAAGATITHHHAVGTDHQPWLEAEIGAGRHRRAAGRQGRRRPGRDPQPRRAGALSPRRGQDRKVQTSSCVGTAAVTARSRAAPSAASSSGDLERVTCCQRLGEARPEERARDRRRRGPTARRAAAGSRRRRARRSASVGAGHVEGEPRAPATGTSPGPLRSGVAVSRTGLAAGAVRPQPHLDEPGGRVARRPRCASYRFRRRVTASSPGSEGRRRRSRRCGRARRGPPR